MSKQANQKYRKEKEKEHLKKAGIEPSGTGNTHHISKQAALNNEMNAPGEKTER